MTHKFNALQFSTNSVKFWLRPTLRKNRENFTILGLIKTLRKASEILINAFLTKTTENLNTPGEWRGVRQGRLRANSQHAQGYYIYVASWKLELEAGNKLEAGIINTEITCICKLERV